MARRRSRGSTSKLGPWIALAALAVLFASGAKPPGYHKPPAAGATATTAVVKGDPSRARTAIRWAQAQEGCPYVYGGTGPCAAGFDCSGLLQAAYAAAGVAIPRTSEGDWAQLPHVPMSGLEPGDLILYTGGDTADDPPPGHVVLYLGGGRVIEAYATGYPVRVDNYVPAGAWGAVRPG